MILQWYDNENDKIENHIGSEGVMSLFETLKTNTSLNTLNLSGDLKTGSNKFSCDHDNLLTKEMK